ncbi:magnesium/cobalt transporter CorA [Mycolicibacterium smegmatis]|uniref:Magnesium transport protein CorA n=2 Tax=Mycolicibacterium smegmatis (strain ATCC 700084 / mc(2)155) TaxID=246196 RepID=A0R2B8_MYCS2|nr:magnesium/cobalt transporter CorA [Mycolicibacterium smegmatis]ABK71548.1 magnesium and cobalt transport protein CorA [Mycolicibacterium smegmatis MC2 155]AFP41373.1 Magnesium and cobalt transport protein CorA [Mycolicibacterium smegmatis MC2 155]AIU10094.1 magnesium transporter [Mycolicibacterium smegmatis MC2 155]AIU16719.1 magnesium transporter [Mycolicibacterium smegmatis]AIU23342.1 magnesium transporter [Mycolicibacterium smegmatis]
MAKFRATRAYPNADIHAPVAHAMVDCGVYCDGTRLPGKYTHAAAVDKVRELQSAGKKAFVWIGLHEPDEFQMQSVADVFSLHELAVEDAVHAHQRPKLERYDTTLFLVLKTINYVEHDSMENAREIVETGEIMVFVGPEFVVTVRHGDHSGLAGVRKRLDSSPSILKLGPFAVMHAIADHVVDSYLDVTDLIETDIDAMEEDVFSPRSRSGIEYIYLLKREVVEMRRAVAPLTQALSRLLTDHNDLISVEVRRYMRDVLDHNVIASERVASYDEMLSSLVQAALGKIAVQQNVDMRKISAWVAIAAVPTALAGIYGMNFDNMPELHWAWGYPAVLCVMAVVCFVLYRTFRRNNWL